MVEIVNGNILDSKENIIVQQVNCKGVMGAGLAKQIRDKWPKVYIKYKKICNSSIEHDIPLLGKALIIKVGIDKYIANLFGQDNYGRGKQQTDYVAFEKALDSIMSAASFSKLTVAVPYGIGCGLAGGDWDTIHALLIKASFKHDVKITIYKL